MNEALGRYLSIDYGAKRVGLAISDQLGMIAFPAGNFTSRQIFHSCSCRPLAAGNDTAIGFADSTMSTMSMSGTSV